MAMPMYDDEAKRVDYYKKRFEYLKNEASEYRAYWKELSDYFAPRNGIYLTGDSLTDNNSGKKKHSKIINGSALAYVRTATAGLYSGCTPPTLPWFEFGLDDKELQKYKPVKTWLIDVRDIVLDSLSRSNFYDSMYQVYKELLVFGTGCNTMDESFDTGVRCRTFTIGEYYIALGTDLRPAELFRLFAMTAGQMVKAFGYEKVSNAVQTAFDSDARDQRFNVLHVIEPNNQQQYGRLDAGGRPWLSTYFEYGSEAKQFLEIKGYYSQPFIAPRWSVVSGNSYGDSPGMDALGDQKQLQQMEKKKLKALDKAVDPPLNVPAGLKNQSISQIPGGINYVGDAGGSTITPTMQVRTEFQAMLIEKEAVETRIKNSFYNELFLAVLGNDKTATATEIAKRYEEKLQILGPELNRLYSEAFTPIINRAYDVLDRAGRFPKPPRELQGRDIGLNFISTLARAQKLVNVSSIEQTTNYIIAVGQAIPDAIDSLDIDKAVAKYVESVGAPPSIIRSEEEIAQIRQTKQQMQMAMMQQQAAQQAAETSRTMSETKLGEDSALDAAVGGA